MNWHIPALDEIKILQNCSENNTAFANNYSSVNSFLFSSEYHSELALEDGWLFEKYVVAGENFYSFPHNVSGDGSNLFKAVSLLEEDAKKSNHPCVFRNITLEEKEVLIKIKPLAQVSELRELEDYIYLSENLANLPGSKYSKKRNHINQFLKKYPEYRFEKLSEENLQSAMEVEEAWIGDSDSEALKAEKIRIQNVFANFGVLTATCGLSGGLIFVQDKPIAFCLASYLSSQVTDIHFEKCIEPFAHDGGYAIINRDFARTVSSKYINREEDLGIEGLRKAKLSYYPETILQKFCAKL